MNKNNPFREAFVVSLIVSVYAFMFHATTVTPVDFSKVIMWLPVYLSPIWILAIIVYLKNRGKN